MGHNICNNNMKNLLKQFDDSSGFSSFDKILFSAQSILIKIHRFLFDLTCILSHSLILLYLPRSIHLFSSVQCMPRFDRQSTNQHRIEIANEPASASKSCIKHETERRVNEYQKYCILSLHCSTHVQSMSRYPSRYDISKLIIKVLHKAMKHCKFLFKYEWHYCGLKYDNYSTSPE